MKNIIVLKQNKYGTKSYHLSDSKIKTKLIALVTSAIAGVLLIGVSAGYFLFKHTPTVDSELVEIQTVVEQKEQELCFAALTWLWLGTEGSVDLLLWVVAAASAQG